MKEFKNLTAQQKQDLLKFPVYISLLAATDSKLDEAERMAVIKFAHIKAFSCHPPLTDFCRESDLEFQNNLAQIESLLPKDKKGREAAIQKELLNLETILSRLGKEYGKAMHHSLKTFREHVLKAHHSVIEDFILPISIPGLTE